MAVFKTWLGGIIFIGVYCVAVFKHWLGGIIFIRYVSP